MGNKNFYDTVKSLRFTAVYWIDDEHAAPADVHVPELVKLVSDRVADSSSNVANAIISAFKENAREPLQKFIKDWVTFDKKIAKEPDADIDFDIRGNIENALERAVDLSATAAEDLLNALAVFPGAMSSRQKQIIGEIFSEIDESVEVHILSFSDWARRKAEITDRHDANKTALVLLDQQNAVEPGAPDGRSVIADILKASERKPDTFHVLMVTSLCRQNEEHKFAASVMDEIRAIAPAEAQEKKGNGCDVPLFAMSKYRLHKINVADVATAKLEFEALLVDYFVRLKLSDLSRLFAVETKDQLKTAVEDAYYRLRRMSLEEFMYAVAGSPRSEGVSELDALIRLFAVEQRRALTLQVVKNSTVRDLLREMRGLSMPFDSLDDLASQEGLQALRHSEAFEPEASLNGLYQPITSGDVFRFTQKTVDGGVEENISRDYVLVSNACDLMLRGEDGARKLTRQGIVLPIINFQKSEDVFPLPCKLGKDSGDAVWFSDILTVPLALLDLCAYRIDGLAKWEKGGFSKLGRSLLESQIKRARIIEELFSSGEAKVDEIRNIVSSVISSKVEVEEGGAIREVIFDVKRISRITPAVASELVHKFAVFLGRPALEYDYSMNRKSIVPSD